MNSKFFERIDKANKVLLFLCAVFFIVMISKDLITELLREQYTTPVVKVISKEEAQSKQIKPNIKERFMRRIKDVYLFEIQADMIIKDSYSLSDSAHALIIGSNSLSNNAVNLLFVKESEPRLLLLDSNGFVEQFSATSEIETIDSYILSKNLYSIARADTNNDGFLKDDDKLDFYVSEYDGTDLTKVMENITDYRLIDNNRVFIQKQLENNRAYYIYNVKSGKVSKLDTQLR